ncbi:4'-phosphopantetheine phosphatase isoform X1 [Hydra vulgaris]|uniref:4'-phosphopantetheine phosphatase isoform X1 n=2 Tax=Hydra vulgaris TaxID=6087 RepID=UPI001F5FB64F|nr:4'-phosphopantetheine phosphatase-like isoform X1 [Hydra vulgaris]
MAINSLHESYAKSIELPQSEVFRNLSSAKRFAIDIGGSLAKIAYLAEVENKRTRHYSKSYDSSADELNDKKVPLYTVEEQVERRDRIHFVKFETKYIEDSLDFIQKNLMRSGNRNISIKATGGGAHKYKELIKTKLNVEVEKLDEMQCLISGCNFLLSNVPNECFQFHQKDGSAEPEYLFKNLVGEDVFPYLLVNIGSGVSIIKVESNETFERIGGTSTGGGTFWGLGSLLTDAKGFDELLSMAAEGKTKNINMLVKDIYGGAYSEMNLPGDLTASSFGKAARASRDQSTSLLTSARFRPQDIAKALLQMVSNDIGQISSLYAQLHNLKRIVFGGYFIRGHPVTMHTISFAINFFSKGKLHALFMRHEGYLGAIGAFLSTSFPHSDSSCWLENLAGSSAFPENNEISASKFGKFELDRIRFKVEPCPLLVNCSEYKPDLIDLGSEEIGRAYWINVFEEGIDSFVEKAIQSQSGQSDAEQRAAEFKKQFLERLNILKVAPYSFGQLTVRSLLDTRDQFLAAFSFCDPYLQIKQAENEQALLLLRQHLKFVDSLSIEARQIELIEGLVSGNIFDWGALESVKHLENPLFGLKQAREKIQKRPWLTDDVDSWLSRFKEEPHKLAIIFTDNSGVDILLGVIPFVRELLKRGTKVVLAANSYPAINDVIYSELIIVCERVAEMCPIIRNALSDEMLCIMETGSSSACLDLLRIEIKLAAVMRNADLILLEGMGRCIHTNYMAEFKCEVIRCAVLKNPWLAERLGGKLFDVIFKYTRPSLSS